MKTGTIEFWKQWKVIIRFGVVSLTQTSTTAVDTHLPRTKAQEIMATGSVLR